MRIPSWPWNNGPALHSRKDPGRISGGGIAFALPHRCDEMIYRSIFVPTLTYGHEGWVMTERTRSRIHAAGMGFLRRVAGVSLRDRVKSSVLREGLRVEPQLLCVERSQLRWFGHLVRMPPGRLPWQVFQARPAGRRPRGRPRTRWRDYISTLAWERLGIPQSELVKVAREREVWGPMLEL